MLRDTSKIWPNPICRVARHQNDPVADPFPDSNLPPTQSKLSGDWRARPNQGFVMSIEPSPHNKPARLGKFRGAAYADNVVPFHKDKALLQGRELLHRGEEFFAALSPLLEEVAGLRGDESPHRETKDLLRLLEENARLRKLAVQLSNLLGDLPETGSSPERRAAVDDG